jgi:hypothetical protein
VTVGAVSTVVVVVVLGAAGLDESDCSSRKARLPPRITTPATRTVRAVRCPFAAPRLACRASWRSRLRWWRSYSALRRSKALSEDGSLSTGSATRPSESADGPCRNGSPPL